MLGINWQLIFGEEIAGAADLSAAVIARVCGGGMLWLWACVSMFVQEVMEYAAAAEGGVVGVGRGNVYLWPQVASATIVGLPVMMLLMPLPLLHWRTRLAWMRLLLKMVAVPFVEVLFSSTPKPKPQAPNPKSEITNIKPQTPNPKPQTTNLKPQTTSHKP